MNNIYIYNLKLDFKKFFIKKEMAITRVLVINRSHSASFELSSLTHKHIICIYMCLYVNLNLLSEMGIKTESLQK